MYQIGTFTSTSGQPSATPPPPPQGWPRKYLRQGRPTEDVRQGRPTKYERFCETEDEGLFCETEDEGLFCERQGWPTEYVRQRWPRPPPPAPSPYPPPEIPNLHPPPPQSPSLSQRALSQTLARAAKLLNLLPAGTLLAFQLLIPLFTNKGICDAATRPMTLALLLLLAASCFLASFTDSLSLDGQVFYGFATPNGLRLFDYRAMQAAAGYDLRKYRLRFTDGVHAVLSVLVFGAAALRDRNVVTCFYPALTRETREVLDIVPMVIVLICSLLFVVSPTSRAGTANLVNLLPTGTLLAFQLLTPLFTNNGTCDAVKRLVTLALLLLLAASCFLASFTDSFRSPDGQVFYGFVTPKGLWLFYYPAERAAAGTERVSDLGNYRLRFIDGVHAVLSVLMFGALALRDWNVMTCFYPAPARDTREILDIVPIGIGLICSLLFVVFPTGRHGIGYPVTPAGREVNTSVPSLSVRGARKRS